MRPVFIERSLPADGESVQTRRVRRVTVNLAESPLGWLKSRKLVSDRQFVAGELLRRDYERASLGAQVTMRWDAAPRDSTGRGSPDPAAPTITGLCAKERFLAAIDHAGAGLSDILWRVVCAGEPLPGAEKSLGWPARAGRLVLTLALDRVADYYQVP